MTTDTTSISPAQQDMLDSLRRGRPAAGQDPAKRQQIIDGARRVFIDMGFDAASMNDITREAGVSKGTIYVYFASKEELFEALIEEERCAIFNDLYSALEQGGDVRDTLIRFGVALATKITSEKVTRAQRTVIGICERIPELGARFYERGPKHGHAKLMAFMNAAVEKGQSDDCRRRARRLSAHRAQPRRHLPPAPVRLPHRAAERRRDQEDRRRGRRRFPEGLCERSAEKRLTSNRLRLRSRSRRPA